MVYYRLNFSKIYEERYPDAYDAPTWEEMSDDIIGTLNEKDFQNFFIEWASDKNFVLVSGSPYKKIERQLGKTIISMAQSVFPCSGLEQWQNFKPVWHYNYIFPSDLYILLENSST